MLGLITGAVGGRKTLSDIFAVDGGFLSGEGVFLSGEGSFVLSLFESLILSADESLFLSGDGEFIRTGEGFFFSGVRVLGLGGFAAEEAVVERESDSSPSPETVDSSRLDWPVDVRLLATSLAVCARLSWLLRESVCPRLSTAGKAPGAVWTSGR